MDLIFSWNELDLADTLLSSPDAFYFEPLPLEGSESVEQLDRTGHIGAPEFKTDTREQATSQIKTAEHEPIYFQHSDEADVSNEVYERKAQAIILIENMTLSLLSQVSAAMSTITRDAFFDGKPDDIKFKLANRNGNEKKHEQTVTKTIKYPGNAKSELNAHKLACLFSVLNYIHEALVTGLPATKRDLFYRNVKLFKSQSVVDHMVDDLAATFGLRRSDLNIVSFRTIRCHDTRSTAKGMFCGTALRLVLQDGTKIYGNNNEATLIPAAQDIAIIELDEDVSWILVVEKEAVFQTLCREGFAYHSTLLGPGIIITGRGYPDISTRELVHNLSSGLPESIPCLGLMDADPHGMDIMSVYKYGSQKLKHEGKTLESPKLKWIGLRLTEITTLGIEHDTLLPFNKHDHQKAISMLKRSREVLPDRWRRELSAMLHIRRKAELELLSDVTTNDSGFSASGLSMVSSSPLCRYLSHKIWKKIERSRRID